MTINHRASSYAPRLVGEKRTAKARELAKEYNAGSSIRALVDVHGMSYGTVRALLVSQKVTFRPRGGGRRPSS